MTTGLMPKKVCIQGLGFVGMASAIAVASARSKKGEVLYQVTGVELPTERGQEIVAQIQRGQMPIESTDQEMQQAFSEALELKNLTASTSENSYDDADIVLMAVHLDVDMQSIQNPQVNFRGMVQAAKTLGQHLKPGSLVIVETTVPPGTCRKIIQPVLSEELTRRGLPSDAIMLAHSYERVMPGKNYLTSIKNFWRVYSGIDKRAADACETFLNTIINVDEFPLSRLKNTESSEMGKILENSYRAMTIAFMEEWSRFAENIDVDLFQVIDAIRMRPTHSNIRQPGFGVGGYCLTKDPLFAQFSAHQLFQRPDLQFPFNSMAVQANQAMPFVTVDALRKILGSFKNKKILLLGASYRQDVADLRHSPSSIFVKKLAEEGAEIVIHDPLVKESLEGLPVTAEIPYHQQFDALVLAVQHQEYANLNFSRWPKNDILIFDANRVLSDAQVNALLTQGYNLRCIGRGLSV
ncbi:MAG: nucleotide sugar dehydrogenase [Bdellovibrio sp. CG10_big_fil_rev_8_21_14_0_10_47_8]|nr:MAG: nucleotide sugar dehydrogenase [Bdellovibrio sp. CG10_big_fil_rev_8_21_14_0_10_47_8]